MLKLRSLIGGLLVLTALQLYARDEPYAVPFEVGQRVEITLAKPYRTAEGVRVSATHTELSGKPLMTVAARGREKTRTEPIEQGRVRGLLTAVDGGWLTLDLGGKQPLLRIPRAAIVRWETLGLAAQGTEPLPPGERIRVVAKELGGQGLTGHLLAIDDETLLLKVAGRVDPIRLRRASVGPFDVSRGERRYARVGAVMGAIISLPAGAYLAEWARFDGGGQGGTAALAFAGSVACGAAIGALIGSAFKSERWERVPLSVAVAPQPHGARAALTLRF